VLDIPTSEVVALLRALIRNECVNDGSADSGHEDRSVATLAEYFGAAGTVVEPHPGRQSVVYRVPGRVPGAPTLTLLPHLDVVPANPSGWSRDPFGAEISDGFVWGRGALDMLNVTAAMAAAFRRYLDGDVPPLAGDLIFAAVADEEAGGGLGARILAAEHWDLVGCDYLLTEVASPGFSTAAGLALPVTVAEKGPAWRSLLRSGTPSHGSQPYGTDNALVGLSDAVSKLASAETPVEISPEWLAFIGSIGLDPELVAALSDPDRVDAAIEQLDDPQFARWAHACTHLTVTPTILHAGDKQNTVPDRAKASIDVRLAPGQDLTTLDDFFRKVLGPGYEEVAVVPDVDFPPLASPAEGPLWEAIRAAANELAGPATSVPMLTPVTTDARFFRARGVTAYGVGLFDDTVGFAESLAMFHGNDERVSVHSLELTTRMIAATLRHFDSEVEAS
jgi:acetylornithine deacetylase/succinyl-diaminopimelate desuccinylase-like protein